MSIRVLIADDHPFFRFGLRARLSVEPQIEVVGEAVTGKEAIALAVALDPNVILMDLNFKTGINGIEATRQIRQTHPEIEVLVITYFDDHSVFEALKAGARGYLLKDAEVDAAVSAIHAVSRGEAIYSPAIAQRVIDYINAPRSMVGSQAFPELTKREHEILALIVRGYTNTAIARQLYIEEGTVRNHVSKIYDKLHVLSRLDAIRLAQERGVS